MNFFVMCIAVTLFMCGIDIAARRLPSEKAAALRGRGWIILAILVGLYVVELVA